MVLELIDMDADEWRGKFRRGDAFRSKTVATCGICSCSSNLWFMGGYPGIGPRLVCPGRTAFPDLHDELEKKLDQVTWNEHPYLPKSVIDEIKKEIEQDLAKFKNIRPDVLGANA